MPVPMTSLERKNGDWFSRKAIPKDVRDAYRRAYGKSQEERFRLPGSLPLARAKQEFREWDATISGRIASLRAAANGEGQSLSHREAHELAAQWYVWFTGKFEDEPGTPEQWDERYERLQDAYGRFSDGRLDFRDGEPKEDLGVHPTVRRHVRATVLQLSEASVFLAETAIKLTPESESSFLDVLEKELVAAWALLRRRAEGDYLPDSRRNGFASLARASATASQKPSGLTCWSLFEAWVAERRPGTATVNRWRAVFMALEERFKERDIAAISTDEAIDWKGTLVTAQRNAAVANEIWLNAARTVFGWALANQKITTNPFDGVRVAAPRHAPKMREREFTEAEWKAILAATLKPPSPGLARHHADVRFDPRATWQAINRRVIDLQRKMRARNELTAIHEHDHIVDYDADLPFGRADVRLAVQRWWWRL